MKTETERLAVIEQQLEQNEKDHERIEKTNRFEHSEILEVAKEIKAELRDFKSKADTKYASKTVEKVVYGMVGIILTGVVLGILSQVLK